jgi:EmrB/QacA subfamily drug resistance transporter
MTSARQNQRFDPRWLPLGVTTIGAFMSLLDSTIVNIALPDILKDFHANLGSGQLVLTVYLLALALVIPLSGFLGERIGMKRLYMITLVLFTAGSALCGFAWNLQSLILFRALQGLGGGMLQPLGQAIVFTMITPRERGYFMGLLGLPSLLAPILGPTVGGYLVEYSTWRMIFLINLPIGLINLALAWRLLKETPIRQDARLDRLGLGLSAIAFPCILLALSDGGSFGWLSWPILGALFVGGAALALFVRTELKNPQPLLKVSLFSNRMFALAMIIIFVTQFALFGVQYLLPIFLETAHGMSPAQTGLVLLPSGFVSFIAMNLGGRSYNRLGPKPLAVAGMAVLVVTTIFLSRISEDTSPFLIAAFASSRGVGVGLCVIPVNTMAYNTVAHADMPRATAMVNVLFRIFGSVATAILTAVLVASLGWHGAPAGSSITGGTAPVRFMVKAFSDGFLVMAAFAVVGLVLSFFVRDRILDNPEPRLEIATQHMEPGEA